MVTKTAGLALLMAIVTASPALAQNATRNIGNNNVGGNNVGGNNIGVQPQPYPEPCRYNCYGGSREQVIGGVVGGIIGGIIAGSRQRRQAQNPQPIAQQPIQPQQGQYNQVQNSQNLSQQHYQYCINRFKSYVIQTNTYTSFSGQTRYCNSPYN